MEAGAEHKLWPLHAVRVQIVRSLWYAADQVNAPCRRLEIVSDSTAALRKALGPHCAAVGLSTLGTAAVQPAWTDAEEALLEEGMRAWGRDFRQVHLVPPPGFCDGIDNRSAYWAHVHLEELSQRHVAHDEGPAVTFMCLGSRDTSTFLHRRSSPCSAVHTSPARAACCTAGLLLRRSRSSCCRRRVRRTS
jgi:hypothetical protein